MPMSSIYEFSSSRLSYFRPNRDLVRHRQLRQSNVAHAAYTQQLPIARFDIWSLVDPSIIHMKKNLIPTPTNPPNHRPAQTRPVRTRHSSQLLISKDIEIYNPAQKDAQAS